MVSSILKPSSHTALPKTSVIRSEPRDPLKLYLKSEATTWLQRFEDQFDPDLLYDEEKPKRATSTGL